MLLVDGLLLLLFCTQRKTGLSFNLAASNILKRRLSRLAVSLTAGCGLKLSGWRQLHTAVGIRLTWHASQLVYPAIHDNGESLQCMGCVSEWTNVNASVLTYVTPKRFQK